MKFIISFLFLITSLSSRRIKRRKSTITYEIEQISRLDAGGFGTVYRAKLVGTSINSSLRFVVKFPIVQFIEEFSFGNQKTQSTKFDNKEHESVALFEKELKTMHFLNSLIKIADLPSFNLINDESALRNQDLTTIENYREEINLAKRNPFARMLNSDNNGIVLFQYDCNILDFLKAQEKKPLLHSVSRLIQVKIIEAVRFLHENHIIHCDIKLENIMLKAHLNEVTVCSNIKLEHLLQNDFIVAIIDFGGALIETNIKESDKIGGTITTMAPEVFNLSNERSWWPFFRKVDGLAADIYSLGVTLLEIETLNNVFVDFSKYYNEYRNQVIKALKTIKNEDYKNFLGKLLDQNPLTRPKIWVVETEIIEIFEREIQDKKQTK